MAQAALPSLPVAAVGGVAASPKVPLPVAEHLVGQEAAALVAKALGALVRFAVTSLRVQALPAEAGVLRVAH
jgi:hypothetical protein